MPAPSVREARPADVPFITALANHHIRSTTSHWHEIERSVADRLAWLANLPAAHAATVCELDGELVGFGSFGSFRPWSGFNRTVEHSVYVAEGRQRLGIGRAILLDLVERARARGHHVMVAAISADQEPSLALHRTCGFTEVGRMPQVGLKFGRRLDLVLMQKVLG